MGNFIVNGATELPGLKTDAQEPTGAAGEWAGADANKLREALLDVRDHLYPMGAWIDLTCSVEQASKKAALTFEAYRDTTFEAYFLSRGTDNTLFLTFQMPHGWIINSTVRPHLHVIPMANPATTEVAWFSGKYAWSAIGGELPVASGWTPFGVGLDVTTTSAFKQAIVPLFNTTPTGMGLSSILSIEVSREGTSNNDTYTTGKSPGLAAANLCLVSIDAHVMVYRPGSANETSG